MPTLSDCLEILSKATHGDVYDHEYNGGCWMFKAVETQESIVDFEQAVSKYADCCAMISGTLAGFSFVTWRQVQVRKGDPRRALSVIDFGMCRFAIDADLTEYA